MRPPRANRFPPAYKDAPDAICSSRYDAPAVQSSRDGARRAANKRKKMNKNKCPVCVFRRETNGITKRKSRTTSRECRRHECSIVIDCYYRRCKCYGLVARARVVLALVTPVRNTGRSYGQHGTGTTPPRYRTVFIGEISPLAGGRSESTAIRSADPFIVHGKIQRGKTK